MFRRSFFSANRKYNILRYIIKLIIKQVRRFRRKFMNKFIMALDAGTTSTRAILFDKDSNIVS